MRAPVHFFWVVTTLGLQCVFIYISEMKNNTQMLKLQDTSLSSLIETEVLLSLRPILETWSGQKLSRNHVLYGIRRYLRGASFMSHVDRLPTHIISAILQVSFPIIASKILQIRIDLSKEKP